MGPAFEQWLEKFKEAWRKFTAAAGPRAAAFGTLIIAFLGKAGVVLREDGKKFGAFAVRAGKAAGAFAVRAGKAARPVLSRAAGSAGVFLARAGLALWRGAGTVVRGIGHLLRGVGSALARAFIYLTEHPKKALAIFLPIIGGCALGLYLMLTAPMRANVFSLSLTMNGPERITLEVGTPYEEAGAEAFYEGTTIHEEDTDVPVETIGTVDTTKTGTYCLTYRASHGGLSQHAYRTVYVRDTAAPQITLTADPDHYTLPGQTYEEEGFAASDAYDGDLTSRVVRREQNGKVYYLVADNSMNMTSVVRDIVYDDRDAPEITLLDAPESIIAGDPWEDSFYAEDNVLGDVTDRVTVTTDFNNYVPGTYTMTYTVTDDYKNTATAERTVTVRPIPKNDPSLAVDGEKIVFLTFDDGPGPYTEELLEILEKYNVRATFFVTAQYSEYLPLLKSEAAEGHTVAVHSYSHEYDEIYSSTEAFWEDFDTMNDLIEQYTGDRSKIMRFPGGSSNGVSAKYSEGIMTKLTVEAQRKGYDYYDWNVESGDAGDTTDPDEIVENILDGIRSTNISVVLCHDIHSFTVEAIEPMLREAIEDGYTFLPITFGCFESHHTVNN